MNRFRRLVFMTAFLVIGLGLIAGGYWYTQKHIIKPPTIHYHAGFQVYIDGVLQDYSGDTYMRYEPCTINPQQTENDPAARAHLHDNIGDVVHIHAAGVVWGDVITFLKLTLDPTKPIEAYVNGKQVSDILNSPIHAYDSLVLLIGSHGKVDDYLLHQVTKDHILAVESKSESCGN